MILLPIIFGGLLLSCNVLTWWAHKKWAHLGRPLGPTHSVPERTQGPVNDGA